MLEPMKVKAQAIMSASETSEIILKIDDTISSKGEAPAGGPRRYASRRRD